MGVMIESIVEKTKRLPLLRIPLEFFRILIVAITNFCSPFTSEDRRSTNNFELFYRCAIEHVTGKATEDVVRRLDYKIVKVLAQIYRTLLGFAGKVAGKFPGVFDLCSKAKRLVAGGFCLWLGILQAIFTWCLLLAKQSCEIVKAPVCFARSQLIKLKPVREVDIVVCGVLNFFAETSKANFRGFVRNVRSIVEGAKQSLDLNANIGSSFLKSNGSIIGEFLNKFEVEIFYSPHSSIKIIQTAKTLLSRSEAVSPQLSSSGAEPEVEEEENNSDRKNSGHEISSSSPEESPEVQIEKEVEQAQAPEQCEPATETPLYHEGSDQAESTQHAEPSTVEPVDSQAANSHHESPSREEDPKPAAQEQQNKKNHRGKKGKR